MRILRTLGWNIADYFIRRHERKSKHTTGQREDRPVGGPTTQVQRGSVLRTHRSESTESVE